MPGGLEERMGDVRAAVTALKIAVLAGSAEQISQCLPAVTQAAQWLATLRPANRSADDRNASRELRHQCEQLRSDLATVGRLIEQGARYQRWWAGLLGASIAGYGRSGQAAPLAVPSGVAVRG